MDREVGQDGATVAPVSGKKPYKRGRRVKPYLLTRDQLDGRTGAAKAFDALVIAIENDLGGPDALKRSSEVWLKALPARRSP